MVECHQSNSCFSEDFRTFIPRAIAYFVEVNCTRFIESSHQWAKKLKNSNFRAIILSKNGKVRLM